MDWRNSPILGLSHTTSFMDWRTSPCTGPVTYDVNRGLTHLPPHWVCRIRRLSWVHTSAPHWACHVRRHLWIDALPLLWTCQNDVICGLTHLPRTGPLIYNVNQILTHLPLVMGRWSTRVDDRLRAYLFWLIDYEYFNRFIIIILFFLIIFFTY